MPPSDFSSPVSCCSCNTHVFAAPRTCQASSCLYPFAHVVPLLDDFLHCTPSLFIPRSSSSWCQSAPPPLTAQVRAPLLHPHSTLCCPAPGLVVLACELLRRLFSWPPLFFVYTYRSQVKCLLRARYLAWPWADMAPPGFVEQGVDCGPWSGSSRDRVAV